MNALAQIIGKVGYWIHDYVGFDNVASTLSSFV